MDRKRRRAIILTVYALMAFGLLWMIASAVRPAPSCTDGKRNQNEVGVDCGGVCGACPQKIVAQDIVVNGAWVIDGVDGRVDVVAQVTNPNDLYGAEHVRYTVEMRDAQGNIVGEATDETFILPAETKYILLPGLTVRGAVTSAALRIAPDVQWTVFHGYQKPRIVVLNKRYELLSSSTAYARVRGLVRNESPYDFARLWVKVVLKDAQGVPVAIHRTRMDVMDAGAERAFSLPWPSKITGDVVTVDVEVEANVFDVDNFRTKYIAQ